MLTRGIELNDLVGKRFTVGSVQLEGVELCGPCNLQSLTRQGVLAASSTAAAYAPTS